MELKLELSMCRLRGRLNMVRQSFSSSGKSRTWAWRHYRGDYLLVSPLYRYRRAMSGRLKKRGWCWLLSYQVMVLNIVTDLAKLVPTLFSLKIMGGLQGFSGNQRPSACHWAKEWRHELGITEANFVSDIHLHLSDVEYLTRSDAVILYWDIVFHLVDGWTLRPPATQVWSIERGTCRSDTKCLSD